MLLGPLQLQAVILGNPLLNGTSPVLVFLFLSSLFGVVLDPHFLNG